MSGYRKLGRPTDQRRAMLRGMVTYLLENGAIETTLMRAGRGIEKNHRENDNTRQE